MSGLPVESVGVVLGSQEAGPLKFWVGVKEEAVLQLDDLVVVRSLLGNGETVSFYGVVDIVQKRYEGDQFDTDAFRAAEGVLPVEVSYSAHIQVTRVDPEVFAPPHPGTAVTIVHGEEFQKALFIDRMEHKLPIGNTRTGETVHANLEFLDGSRGAHASISGVSGVATKTSYATFLLYSMFNSGVLGSDGTNTRALIFNVKGEDLLWLDKANTRLDDELRANYERLGLPAGPFESVGLFAPVRRGSSVPIADVGSRHEGVSAFAWTLREFAEERLLHFAFVESSDSSSQLSFLISRVETHLEQAAKEGQHDDVGITVGGQWISTFDELVHLLDTEILDQIAPRAASGTLDALRRRLHGINYRVGHLIGGDQELRNRKINWRENQVTVVDIHNLHETAQMFVVGVVLRRMMRDKESQGTARPLVFIMLDELNKYAPRSGHSPILEVLRDIAERGRSLGICLLGAQQTASEVERRIVANAALKVVGRLDAAEAERSEYGFLTRVTRERAKILSPGTMIVSQPEIPTPVLVNFPFPAWATRQSEVQIDEDTTDPFARS